MIVKIQAEQVINLAVFKLTSFFLGIWETSWLTRPKRTNGSDEVVSDELLSYLNIKV